MHDRLGFGVFLAPHHPMGESPTLQIKRDLDLAVLLDDLGYDEFWVGEHHSGGWETIASPEMFLAAAAVKTQRIRLGTGVVSIPYHHPFTVAQRIVMLDHLSRGRAMLGVGPGALPSDAFMLGIDPMTQRAQMDEGLGVILRLLTEREPITVDGSWYQLRDAALHLRPIQEHLPVACASMISSSGMKTAGKYGAGVLSVASYSEAGLGALKTQWSFAESSAKEHGMQVDRANWRIVMPFHLAESKEQAWREVADGLKRWNNEYVVGILGRPDGKIYEDGYAAAKFMDQMGGGIFGTPADAIEKIKRLQELSGGFGTVLAFAHDWAPREQMWRSYEMIARFVAPHFQGQLLSIDHSAARVSANKAKLMAAATGAIMKAISSDPRAAEAFAHTKASPFNIAPAQSIARPGEK
ncbi:MAG TPA: LLM class flavin-dependent oxidoreductase [Candidatus Binataceae bacterium]|nr:LLM class flavin-dependent oxidoreductase [Candidatus Binataceae bacterium]